MPARRGKPTTKRAPPRGKKSPTRGKQREKQPATNVGATTTMDATDATGNFEFGCVSSSPSAPRRTTPGERPGDATTGNVKPNHGTDCGIFCVSLSIAQEDRWTDATKRQGWMDSRGGARFENLNSFASDLKFARARVSVDDATTRTRAGTDEGARAIRMNCFDARWLFTTGKTGRRSVRPSRAPRRPWSRGWMDFKSFLDFGRGRTSAFSKCSYGQTD